MLNLLVQLSTLMYGAVFNFIVPAVFGLTLYGEFIAHNALVFLIHRAMTIISEPLIRFAGPPLVLVHSIALNLLALGLFALASLCWDVGSLWLLSGMLLSASVLLSMQALRLRHAYILFLCVVSGSFLALVVWSASRNNALSLERIMEISVWGPSLIGMIYLFMRGAVFPHPRLIITTLRPVLRQVPQLIAISSTMNLLTSALPVFLAPILPARDLGLFRVMTSVIQAASSIFPISPQAALASFVQHARGAELYQRLSALATVYFAMLSMALIVLAMVIPSAAPYVALALCLPIFYYALLAERHLTALGHIRVLVCINLVVVALVGLGLFFIENVDQASMLYVGGFVAYAVALSMADGKAWANAPLSLVYLLCPAAIYLMGSDSWIGLFYAVLLVLITFLRHRPTWRDVRMLWNEV